MEHGRVVVVLERLLLAEGVTGQILFDKISLLLGATFSQLSIVNSEVVSVMCLCCDCG